MNISYTVDTKNLKSKSFSSLRQEDTFMYEDDFHNEWDYFYIVLWISLDEVCLLDLQTLRPVSVDRRDTPNLSVYIADSSQLSIEF